MKDARGTTLKIGQEVAYNLSGEVMKGRILSLSESETGVLKYRGPKYEIKVELLHDDHAHSEDVHIGGYTYHGRRAGTISKVTKPRNLLVLLDGES